MKFAHIADVHLGKKIFPGTPKEQMASQAIYDGFAAFVDNMMIEQPDFIFITGDLFDHVPDKQDLFFVDNLLSQLTETVILYVTGSSDYLKPDSAIWDYNFTSNFYLMNCEEIHNKVRPDLAGERSKYAEGIVDCLHFPKHNLDVYGFCQYNAKNDRNDVESIYKHEPSHLNILLGYGGDEDCEPFEPEDLVQKEFDYVGFGRKHSYYHLKKANFCYAGSLEPLDEREVGDHGYVKGFCDGLISSAKLVPTAAIRYEASEEDAGIDTEMLEQLNRENDLGKTLARMRTSDDLNALAATQYYAKNMLDKLSEISGVPRDVIEKESLSADIVNRADHDMKEDFKQELIVLSEGLTVYNEERLRLDEELEKYPDVSGEINTIEEQIRDKKYGTGTLEFADAQVDKIFDRKRTGFVMWMLSPFVIIFALVTVFGALFAFFAMQWDAWWKIVCYIAGMTVAVGLLAFSMYSAMKKYKKLGHGKKDAVTERAHNQAWLSTMYKELERYDLELHDLKARQAKHRAAAEQSRELEEKYGKIVKRFKIISLIFD